MSYQSSDSSRLAHQVHFLQTAAKTSQLSISHLSADLESKTRQIEQQRNLVREMEDFIVMMKETVARRDRTIENLQRELEGVKEVRVGEVAKREAELLRKLMGEKEINSVLEKKLEERFREVDSLRKERAFLQERVERLIGKTPSSASQSSATGKPTKGVVTSNPPLHIRSASQPSGPSHLPQKQPSHLTPKGPPVLFPSKPSIPSLRAIPSQTNQSSRPRKPSFVHPPINPRNPGVIFSPSSDSPSPSPSPDLATPSSPLPFGLEEDQLFEFQTRGEMDVDSKKLKRDRTGEEEGGRAKVRRRGATLGAWDNKNVRRQGVRDFGQVGF